LHLFIICSAKSGKIQKFVCSTIHLSCLIRELHTLVEQNHTVTEKKASFLQIYFILWQHYSSEWNGKWKKKQNFFLLYLLCCAKGQSIAWWYVNTLKNDWIPLANSELCYLIRTVMKAYLNKSLFSEVSGIKFGLDIYVNVEQSSCSKDTWLVLICQVHHQTALRLTLKQPELSQSCL